MEANCQHIAKGVTEALDEQERQRIEALRLKVEQDEKDRLAEIERVAEAKRLEDVSKAQEAKAKADAITKAKND